MDADTIRTYAEIGTAIGTFALALATFKFAADASRQAKRDRITKEMDLLISPLKIIYHEIESHSISHGINSNWWELCFIPIHEMRTDPALAQRFRDSVKNIDQYRYLAPENLRRLIDEFLLRLYWVEMGKNVAYIKALEKAKTDLYYSGGNASGGFVEIRYHELTQELDSLNKNLVAKTRDLFANIWLRLNRKMRPT